MPCGSWAPFLQAGAGRWCFRAENKAPAGKSLENSAVSADLDTGVAREVWVGFMGTVSYSRNVLGHFSESLHGLPPGPGKPGAAHSGDGAKSADGALE